MIPAKPGTSKEGVGGSHKEAQDEFLKMVGLLEPRYKYTEEVLSSDEAVVLSSALDHQYFNCVCISKVALP